MRKLTGILITLFVVMWGSICFALGTNTLTYNVLNENSIVLTYTIVADVAAGTIPDCTLGTDSKVDLGGLTIGRYLKYGGFWLNCVRAFGNTGGTEVTEDTDMYLYDSAGLDLLGGAGVDLIDNSADTTFWPLIGSIPSNVRITDISITCTVTQPGGTETNSAAIVIEVLFVR